MTIVVGIVDDEDKVWVGADSLTSKGDYGFRQSRPKVFKKGEFVFGGTGSVSEIQHMVYATALPPVKEDQDHYDYLINDLFPEFRLKLRAGGRLEKRDGEELVGTEMMIGWRGKLFIMGRDFAVIEPYRGYEAIGIGQEYALGAMNILEKTDYSPREKIKLAMDAACAHSKGCSPPYTIYSV